MSEADNDSVAQAVRLAASTREPQLARRMNLPLLVLYGLSVTIGAGIYVLVGEVAARAGFYTPMAFVGASLLVALSAASYSELSCRFPVSAGEAAYVQAGLGISALALTVGLLVAASGIVSSAAILRGGAGYVQEFIAAPTWLIALLAGGIMAAIAAWGISQSAWTAAILGVLEVSLLVIIIAIGLSEPAPVAAALDSMVDTPSAGQIASLTGAVLIAFFAFIGFEDLVNVAEEVKDPLYTMPRAIAATLIITTLIYFLVALVAIAHIPLSELAKSSAPLTLLFEKLTNSAASAQVVSFVAIAAVMNGVLVQIVMASRVLYGLSRMGHLPEFLGHVNRRTRTPLAATAIATAIIMALCLSSETSTLADMTSTITLVAFAMINLSLWRLKVAGQPDDIEIFTVPMWVPVTGFFVSLGFVVYEWASRFGIIAG
ncbi:MAG: amino acid permease [Alphaproteobacteria bacterium]|nr:amino acid permease [Alphaproteobacteria bacterium]